MYARVTKNFTKYKFERHGELDSRCRMRYLMNKSLMLNNERTELITNADISIILSLITIEN